MSDEYFGSHEFQHRDEAVKILVQPQFRIGVRRLLRAARRARFLARHGALADLARSCLRIARAGAGRATIARAVQLGSGQNSDCCSTGSSVRYS